MVKNPFKKKQNNFLNAGAVHTYKKHPKHPPFQPKLDTARLRFYPADPLESWNVNEIIKKKILGLS